MFPCQVTHGVERFDEPNPTKGDLGWISRRLGIALPTAPSGAIELFCFCGVNQFPTRGVLSAGEGVVISDAPSMQRDAVTILVDLVHHVRYPPELTAHALTCPRIHPCIAAL